MDSPDFSSEDLNASQIYESEDDLMKVKELSIKLHLTTKRRSVLQWKRIIEEKRRNGCFGKAVLSDFCNFLSNADATGQQFSPKNEELLLVMTEENTMPQMISTDENSNYLKLNAPKSQSKDTLSSTEPEEKAEASKLCKAKDLLPDEANDLNAKETSDVQSQAERRRKIDDALSNIRKDLTLMRLEDRTLARKLLNLRENINQKRAALVCDEHAQMIDYFNWEIEEEKELDEKHKLSDLSSALLRRPDSLLRSPSMLHQIGFNKMTFDFRRFSVV